MDKKKKASHCKRQILYPSINSAEITAVYLVGCIYVLKQKRWRNNPYYCNIPDY